MVGDKRRSCNRILSCNDLERDEPKSGKAELELEKRDARENSDRTNGSSEKRLQSLLRFMNAQKNGARSLLMRLTEEKDLFKRKRKGGKLKENEGISRSGGRQSWPKGPPRPFIFRVTEVKVIQ